jgi:hypothetical protein
VVLFARKTKPAVQGHCILYSLSINLEDVSQLQTNISIRYSPSKLNGKKDEIDNT